LFIFQTTGKSDAGVSHSERTMSEAIRHSWNIYFNIFWFTAQKSLC
jgi:hypothetical protein